jgi:outer membrane protein OmpA-like peptidoglycan-associated protein
VAGPLQPGERHTVRYAVAIVSAGSEDIQNSAYATALGETVRSNDVSAWIRVRTAWPLETRAGIGKVWVDSNADGEQGPGEPGVPGVSIWTEDGEVSVTDQDGRFSYRNLRPGRHGFRLDPVTLPAEYQLATSEATNGLVIRDAEGWTTPRISFRVLPRGARVASVLAAVPWSLSARSRCPVAGVEPDEADETGGRRECATSWWPASIDGWTGASGSVEPIGSAVPDVVHFEFARAELVPASRAALYRVAAALESHEGATLVITGHADSVGAAAYNQRLALARAEAVAARLEQAGIDRARLTVRSEGEGNPTASNALESGRTLNRRVEISFVEAGIRRIDLRRLGLPVPLALPMLLLPEPAVEFEAEIENPWNRPLEGLALRFASPVDSAVATLPDRSETLTPRAPEVAELGGEQGSEAALLDLPTVPPLSTMRVTAWTNAGPGVASARLVSADGSSEVLVAETGGAQGPSRSQSGPNVALDSLPAAPDAATPVEVTVLLRPPGQTWPGQASYTVPSGWEPVAGSSRLGAGLVEDPTPAADRDGKRVLVWSLAPETADTLSIRLRPTNAPVSTEPVRVAALRNPEDREAERGQEFISGPSVTFFAPEDGEVLSSDRHFVGVRGEPGMAVTLFDAGTTLAEAKVRGDGIHDFIAVPLEPGPHVLRARMTNTWGTERWDSLAVHVTGPPAGFVTENAPLRLTAGGHRTGELRVRVLDEWGVPVINRPYVTVAAEGAEPTNRDADGSSVGLQVQPDSAGWMQLGFRAMAQPGKGSIMLSAGDAVSLIDLEILPDVQPLMIAGVGRVGVGASPDAFASLTARGRLDSRTALTLSLDTRDLDAGRDVFGRITNPLEEAQYPLLGDASNQRVVSASRSWFAARLERGLDWAAYGDLATEDFGAGLQLNRYRRALTAAGAHVTTGPVTWKGFGSSTTQSLVQRQIRGAGISGPYELGSEIRAGTEKIDVETRARENPERVLARQTLVRFADYQIDYQRGILLLNRPVAATDGFGNPIFIVATFEAESGGDRSWVWGVRALTDVRKLVGSRALDRLDVGATWVHDGAAGIERDLLGADLALQSGPLTLGGEVSMSENPDSSGVATMLHGGLSLLKGDVTLAASWLNIGSEFSNPGEIALRPGSEEVRLGGTGRLGSGELRLSHDWQSFENGAFRRTHTAGGYKQRVGRTLSFEAGVTADRFESSTGTDESDAGEFRAEWNPLSPLTLWGESRLQFASSGDVYLPDHVSAGASYRVRSFATLEASHRRVFLGEDGNDYSLTNFGLRTRLGSTTEAWSGYEIAGAGGRQNAALIGLRTRLRLTNAWSADGMFERRQSIGDASIGDPVRALPFLQQEDDYWAFGLGTELLPVGSPYRLSARGEMREGDTRSTRLATVAGDVSVSPSLALLSRQEYVEADLGGSGLTSMSSNRLSSLWGLAFRPVRSEEFNALAKFEYVDSENPASGGVLVGRGDETRTILALEGIWAPIPSAELALRWAGRKTEAALQYEDGLQQPLRSRADFVGIRSLIEFTPWLGARADGRLLIEHESATNRWDLAPQLILWPIDALELSAGYRFGDLEDPDFAVRGGHGAFLNIGVRVTEKTFSSAAEFWRPRFERR